MEIKSAEFVKGIIGTDEILKDGKEQIAFVGRSNVGKSSVINSLVGKKKLARSSSIPGRTREINFFLINQKYYFVDLPGYGFAKISKKQREKLRKMIIWYLTYSGVKPTKVVLIIDAKIGMREFDEEMSDLLHEEEIEMIVVANKADKLNQSGRAKLKAELEKRFKDDTMVVLYSAKTLLNKNVLLENIF